MYAEADGSLHGRGHAGRDEESKKDEEEDEAIRNHLAYKVAVFAGVAVRSAGVAVRSAGVAVLGGSSSHRGIGVSVDRVTVS